MARWSGKQVAMPGSASTSRALRRGSPESSVSKPDSAKALHRHGEVCGETDGRAASRPAKREWGTHPLLAAPAACSLSAAPTAPVARRTCRSLPLPIPTPTEVTVVARSAPRRGRARHRRCHTEAEASPPPVLPRGCHPRARPPHPAATVLLSFAVWTLAGARFVL
ncbi:hypothetical protein TRIUR3_07064 [Triticum urartu]|uniref:Uncharacterized protein n=1 Tax=Triticum urartu TaxID=4572 RepID=M7ZC36_TRIUA|nr:hypothetical protein TRIUR3_07064 [Triticum urartu]